MDKALVALIFSLSLFLFGCSGGSSSHSADDPDPAPIQTPPSTPPTITASGNTAPGVVILTDNEIQNIQEEVPGKVIFATNAPSTISVGTVFMTKDGVYKVVSIQHENNVTTATTVDPEINEIFSKLSIKGAIDLTDDLSVSSSNSPAFSEEDAVDLYGLSLRQKASAEIPVAYPISITGSGSSISGSISSVMRMEIDYQFDSDLGGLQTGLIGLSNKIDILAKVKLNKDANAEKSISIKIFRIPIPVSVYDSLLRAVGIRIASIVVPVNAKWAATAGLETDVDVSVNASASSSLMYDHVTGISATNEIDGSSGIVASAISVADSPVLTTVTAQTALYLEVRPALAFLERIALLGLSAEVGPAATLTGQVMPADPPYCLTASIQGIAHINGFFKTPGIDIKTPAYEKVFGSRSVAEIGLCKLPPVISVEAINAGSLVYGDSVLLRSVVLRPDGVQPAYPHPSGSVTFAVGAENCNASINSSGIAECSLSPLSAGSGKSVAANYIGDENYSAALANTSIDVARRPTYSTIGANPTTTTFPGTVTLTATVGPLLCAFARQWSARTRGV